MPTDAENPWSVGPLPIGDEPSHRLSNMEYGGRLSFFLSGIDLSLSALHTWNKMPVFCNGVGEYRRMTMLGADCSLPLGRFVLRGEFAEYLDEAQNQFSILNSQISIRSSSTTSSTPSSVTTSSMPIAARSRSMTTTLSCSLN